MKTCSKCKAEKQLSDFYNETARPDGKSPWCKDCARENKRQRWADPEKRALMQAQFKAWDKEHRSERNEKRKLLLRENPEPNRERVKQWREKNPEKAAAAAKRGKAIRQARTRAAKVKAYVDLQQAWEKQQGICPLCDQPIDTTLKHPDPMSRSIDHIVPFARGGLHVEENIQWTHLQCNLIKGVS